MMCFSINVQFGAQSQVTMTCSGHVGNVLCCSINNPGIERYRLTAAIALLGTAFVGLFVLNAVVTNRVWRVLYIALQLALTAVLVIAVLITYGRLRMHQRFFTLNRGSNAGCVCGPALSLLVCVTY